MTASTSTSPSPFATLDARITRALLALREARIAAVHSPNSDTLRAQTRAEENLDALLDYRYSLLRRSG